MTGDEAIERAREAYFADMIRTDDFEKIVGRAVAGLECWDDLPLRSEIQTRVEARRRADKETSRTLRKIMR